MTLTLDRRYPLVWRSPDSLQLGVDNPPVVLESVEPGHERMLAALAVGLTPAGLQLIGHDAGLSYAQIEQFRHAIEPALVAPSSPDMVRHVVVSGVGPTVDRLILRLAEAGLEAHPTGQEPEAAVATSQLNSADFAIVVSHFVVDPQFRSLWLRRDIPHLPIVFSDTSVTIGPMIEPGNGPCLYCLELHHRDADSAWPALATQLFGKRSAAETPFLASDVAVMATRAVHSRSTDTSHSAAISLTVDASTGEVTQHTRVRHPDCSCDGLVETSAKALREIGTARSRLNVDRSTLPRTTGAASVPA
jgi:bacteriocin biosynthesis cyclodehydratase domain-containing protein